MQTNIQAGCRLEKQDQTKFFLKAGVEAAERLERCNTALGDIVPSEDIQAKRKNAEELLGQLKTLKCPSASEAQPVPGAEDHHEQLVAGAAGVMVLQSGAMAPGFFDGGGVRSEPGPLVVGNPDSAFLSTDPHGAAVNSILLQSRPARPEPPAPPDPSLKRQVSLLRSWVPPYQRDLSPGGLAAAAYGALFNRLVDDYKAKNGKMPEGDELRDIAARSEKYVYGQPGSPWRKIVDSDNTEAMQQLDRDFRTTMSVAAMPFGWAGVAVSAAVMMSGPGEGASPQQLSMQSIAARLTLGLLPPEIRVPAQMAVSESRLLAGPWSQPRTSSLLPSDEALAGAGGAERPGLMDVSDIAAKRQGQSEFMHHRDNMRDMGELTGADMKIKLPEGDVPALAVRGKNPTTHEPDDSVIVAQVKARQEVEGRLSSLCQKAPQTCAQYNRLLGVGKVKWSELLGRPAPLGENGLPIAEPDHLTMLTERLPSGRPLLSAQVNGAPIDLASLERDILAMKEAGVAPAADLSPENMFYVDVANDGKTYLTGLGKFVTRESDPEAYALGIDRSEKLLAQLRRQAGPEGVRDELQSLESRVALLKSLRQTPGQASPTAQAEVDKLLDFWYHSEFDPAQGMSLSKKVGLAKILLTNRNAVDVQLLRARIAKLPEADRKELETALDQIADGVDYAPNGRLMYAMDGRDAFKRQNSEYKSQSFNEGDTMEEVPLRGLVMAYEVPKGTQFVRVFTKGTTNPIGQWLMKSRFIHDSAGNLKTGRDLQIRYALPFIPDSWVELETTEDSVVWVGRGEAAVFGRSNPANLNYTSGQLDQLGGRIQYLLRGNPAKTLKIVGDPHDLPS